MVDQVTLDIGGGVSASVAVMQYVQSLLTGVRSATIEVDNNTDLYLVRQTWKHDHGGFVKFPVDVINPYKPDGSGGCIDVFGSQSKGGSVMTGTEGEVTYYGQTGPDPTDKKVLWMWIWWDNPYLGSNDANAVLRLAGSKDYKLRYAAGGGNDKAPFRFQLFPAKKKIGPQVLDISETG